MRLGVFDHNSGGQAVVFTKKIGPQNIGIVSLSALMIISPLQSTMLVNLLQVTEVPVGQCVISHGYSGGTHFGQGFGGIRKVEVVMVSVVFEFAVL